MTDWMTFGGSQWGKERNLLWVLVLGPIAQVYSEATRSEASLYAITLTLAANASMPTSEFRPSFDLGKFQPKSRTLAKIAFHPDTATHGLGQALD